MKKLSLQLAGLSVLFFIASPLTAVAGRCAPADHIVCPKGSVVRTEGCPEGRAYCGRPKSTRDCAPANTLRCTVGTYANPEGCARGWARCTPLDQSGSTNQNPSTEHAPEASSKID